MMKMCVFQLFSMLHYLLFNLLRLGKSSDSRFTSFLFTLNIHLGIDLDWELGQGYSLLVQICLFDEIDFFLYLPQYLP